MNYIRGKDQKEVIRNEVFDKESKYRFMFLGNVIKKMKSLSNLNDKMGKSPHQLQENIIHSQQLARIGSWTYDIQTHETFWTEEIYHILECSLEKLGDSLEGFSSLCAQR